MSGKYVVILWLVLFLLLTSNLITLTLVWRDHKTLADVKQDAYYAHAEARAIADKVEADKPLGDDSPPF